MINEIHYHPKEGKHLEFVEIHNPAAVEVAVGGWQFVRGIQFEFPVDAVIPAGGFAVVCRDRDAVAAHFGLPVEALLGNTLSSLDNAGETLVLVDDTGTLVDEMRYDDQPPWDTAADGEGPSLERLCPDFASRHPANWVADGASRPTPLAPNNRTLCPPPDLPPPAIAINEIYYHPLEDRDEEHEFVELINNTAGPVDLRDYSFADGIDFTFTESTVVAPGGLIVVCRNQEVVRLDFDIENTVGNFTGQLSNSGERLTLVDAAGNVVDSVRYREDGDWPVAADGLGFSLEKIVPTALSDDPASWQEGTPGDLSSWQSTGIAGMATHRNLVFVYVDGESEFLLDNFSLVNLAQPDVNLIPGGGTFDTGIEGWNVAGNHADSRWEENGGPDGSGALRIIASGRGSGSRNGVSLQTVTELDRSADVVYRLSFDYRYITGAKGLTVRLSGSSARRGIYFKVGSGVIATPGAPNGARRETLPPFPSHIHRFPREPGSQDATWLTTQVRGATDTRVSLTLRVNQDDPVTLEMLDDGLSGDGIAGDGIYGVQVPPQAHSSTVIFRIEANSPTTGSRISPPDTDPTGFHGYYVNDEQPGSPFPVYTIILDPQRNIPARSLISALNCSTYRSASFAHRGDLYFNVGVRRRGQSVCGDPDVIKKFLKVRFNRGREFRDLRKLNFQSLWTDKSLIRERMAWESFRDMGQPYCFHNYIRLHVNGRYFGLYAELEHPGKRFLRRNDLNEEGNLYKATASREEANGTYEKKTNEDGDESDLRQFLGTMHRTPRAQLVSFFEENMDEDAVIDYQASQILTSNRDYPHKNHYLFHDTRTGKWMPITWDMDLTFGKRWDGNFEGVLNDRMDNPGINPWYTTSVDGGGGNHLLDRFFSLSGTWYRRAYIVRLWNAVQEKYTVEFFDRKIAFLHDLLWDEQLEDIEEWGRSRPSANDRRAPAEFEPNLERVKQHIAIRRQFLIRYMGQRHRNFIDPDRLKITEVMYNPSGRGEETEFLELWNNSGREIDISGWTIQGLGETLDDGTREEFFFGENTTIPDDQVFVVAKDPEAFRKRHGDAVEMLRIFGPYPGNLNNAGEELRVKDAGPLYPATVDFLRYGTETPWPVAADGKGPSLELTDVEPNRDNDLAEYWTASLEPDGTPGRLPGDPVEPILFRRGNCNGDGSVNIADALTILRFLFRGGAEPPCLDSCDVDADRSLAITDALVLLNHLFRFTESPSPEDLSSCQPVTRRNVEFCQQSTCEPPPPLQ